MSSNFGDKSASMRMREVIARIARTTVNEMRPENRIGKVYSYDSGTKTARILFAGETTANMLKVHVSDHLIPTVTMIETFSSQGYNAAGDIVRIAGSGGQYYIVDYISGNPRPIFSSLGWTSDVGWTPMTLLNGWVNYGSGHQVAEYCRLQGHVYYHGLIVGTSRTSGLIWNPPVGFRPGDSAQTELWACMSDAGIGRIDTNASQIVWVSGGVAWISLNTIHYPALS